MRLVSSRRKKWWCFMCRCLGKGQRVRKDAGTMVFTGGHRGPRGLDQPGLCSQGRPVPSRMCALVQLPRLGPRPWLPNQSPTGMLCNFLPSTALLLGKPECCRIKCGFVGTSMTPWMFRTSCYLTPKKRLQPSDKEGLLCIWRVCG